MHVRGRLIYTTSSPPTHHTTRPSVTAPANKAQVPGSRTAAMVKALVFLVSRSVSCAS